MKSRLKKISNLENSINTDIENMVVDHSFDNKNENQSEAFLLTKKLFAITPFAPVGTLSYEFARRIEEGQYESLGPIEDAEGNLEEWLYALNDFLNEQEKLTLVANLKKK